MKQQTLFPSTEKPNPYKQTEPPQKFDVIYCDPPWDYDGRTFLNGKAHETGAASDHYPNECHSPLR